jgi:hypothetical protein
VARVAGTHGANGVWDYCVKSGYVDNQVDKTGIDLGHPDVIYILDVIRALVPLIERGGWEDYSERHLDIKLFGVLLKPANDWIFREVKSQASKFAREEGDSKSGGHLVDYLFVIHPSKTLTF